MPDWVDVKCRRGRRGITRPRRWAGRDWCRFALFVGPLKLLLHARRGYGITCLTTERDGEQFVVWDDVDWLGDLLVKKKKPKLQAGDVQPHLAAMESNLFAKHHSLISHCAATAYDDGDPRQPGWFTVKTMGSAWMVEVKDPDTCARLVVVQQTFDDAITLAALLLDSEEAPWEPDPWLTAARAKKKK